MFYVNNQPVKPKMKYSRKNIRDFVSEHGISGQILDQIITKVVKELRENSGEYTELDTGEVLPTVVGDAILGWYPDVCEDGDFYDAIAFVICDELGII